MIIIRNIFSIILGWLIGSVVNMGLIQTGYKLIPMVGVDTNDMDALATVMPTLEPRFFIFPFLAHALGTLIGAVVTGLIAGNNKMKFSMAIGGLFLVGGIIVNYMFTGPIWFTVLDIFVAYIPMAWIGGKLAKSISTINN